MEFSIQKRLLLFLFEQNTQFGQNVIFQFLASKYLHYKLYLNRHHMSLAFRLK